ncbi:MAG: hypothetical protein IKD73_07685 [Selenomonadaceae bacterium]|nr:hypothetical protein [Selenomonadaceae bacterium]
MKINCRAMLLSALALLILLTAGCTQTAKYDADVRLVREGYLQMNPSVPIGKAFDQFFINDSWTSFTSTNNEKIVEFNGECTFNDEPATLKVQFEIFGNEFSVYHVGLNKVPLDDLEGLGVLDKILSEYQP